MADDPPYDLDILPPSAPDAPAESEIRRAIELALRRHGCRRASVDVVVVDDRTIARMNKRYCRQAGPTDVLCLELARSNDGVVDGQIAASLDTARREAKRRGHSVQAELLLYCVHGTLHLLGYDDRDPDDAQRMHAMEDELLEELGIGAVYRGQDG